MAETTRRSLLQDATEYGLPLAGAAAGVVGSILNAREARKQGRQNEYQVARDNQAYNAAAPLRDQGLLLATDMRPEDLSGMYRSSNPFARSGAAPQPAPEVQRHYDTLVNQQANPYDIGLPGQRDGRVVDFGAWYDDYTARGGHNPESIAKARNMASGQDQVVAEKSRRNRYKGNVR